MRAGTPWPVRIRFGEFYTWGLISIYRSTGFRSGRAVSYFLFKTVPISFHRVHKLIFIYYCGSLFSAATLTLEELMRVRLSGKYTGRQILDAFRSALLLFNCGGKVWTIARSVHFSCCIFRFLYEYATKSSPVFSPGK